MKTLTLCPKHRAEQERREPRRWLWSEAAPGLACEREDCTRKADAHGVLNRKARIAEDRRRYYQQNKARIAEGKRRYYVENKARIAEGKRRYRVENKARIAEGQRRYYQQNKARIAEGKRRWRAEHPHYHRDWARARKAKVKGAA